MKQPAGPRDALTAAWAPILGAVLFALAGAVVAQENVDPAAILQQVAAGVTPEVGFREVRSTRLLKVPLVSSGVLRYTPPGRLEKQTLQPFQETVVIDGQQVTIDRDGAQTVVALVEGSTPAVLVQALRAVLGGQVDELQRLYRISAQGTPQQWMLRLQPKEDAEAVELRIAGVADTVREIEVRGRGGDSVTTTLSR